MAIMGLMKMLIPCCLGVNHTELIDEHTDPAAEKSIPYTDAPSAVELQSAATETSGKLFRFVMTNSTPNTLTFNMHIQETINSGKPITIESSYWTKIVLEKLYKAMVNLVTQAEGLHQKLSPVMRKVVDEAKHFAHELDEFQNEHPILAAFIETTALAVLIAILAPILLDALGFGIEGVVEGEYGIFMLLTMLLTNDA